MNSHQHEAPGNRAWPLFCYAHNAALLPSAAKHHRNGKPFLLECPALQTCKTSGNGRVRAARKAKHQTAKLRGLGTAEQLRDCFADYNGSHPFPTQGLTFFQHNKQSRTAMAPTAANAATTPFEALVYALEGRKKRIFQSSGRLPAIWWNGLISTSILFAPFISRLLFSRAVTHRATAEHRWHFCSRVSHTAHR